MFVPTAASVPMLVASIITLVVGTAVLLRDRRSPAALPYFVQSVTFALWLGAMGLAFSSPVQRTADILVRLSYVGISLIPGAVYHFTVALLGIERTQRAPISLAWSGSVLFAIVTPFSELFISGVVLLPWGWYPLLSNWGVVLILWFAVVLTFACVHFIRQLRRPLSASQRSRTTAFLIAFLVGSLGMIDFLPSLGIEIHPIGFVGTTAWVLLSAHAIWKYELSDLAEFAAARVFETMQGAVLVTDGEDRIRMVNRSATDLLGYTEQELLGSSVHVVLDDASHLVHASELAASGEVVRNREMVWRRRDGTAVDVIVSGSSLAGADGRAAGMIHVAADVTERRRSERQALQDPLTGLPNRRMLDHRLGEMLQRGTGSVALLFVDLDGFKEVNDSWGHASGDEVLREVSRRLRGSVRDEDLVARLGGDEFTVLLERSSDAESVTSRLLRAFAEPFHVDGRVARVTASIGITISQPGMAAADMLRLADEEMYRAKQQGKNRAMWNMPREAAPPGS